MRKALLIIDVQNDYFPNGKCELCQSEEALEAIKRLLKYFRENSQPVWYVQHISEENAAFLIPNTDGASIHREIKPLDSNKVIEKHYPNSFYETDLQKELKRNSVTELVVCGMMTHMCVDTTVRAAQDLGYQVTLISDACATKSLEWKGNKISADIVQSVYMTSIHGEFADVMTVNEFLSEVS